MLSVDAQGNIKLTRGDTGKIQLTLTDSNGDPYVPHPEDTITFNMSEKHGEPVTLTKEIPIDGMILTIDPADTKDLDFKTFVYDIKLVDHDGIVSTVVLAKLTITKSVG